MKDKCTICCLFFCQREMLLLFICDVIWYFRWTWLSNLYIPFVQQIENNFLEIFFSNRWISLFSKYSAINVCNYIYAFCFQCVNIEVIHMHRSKIRFSFMYFYRRIFVTHHHFGKPQTIICKAEYRRDHYIYEYELSKMFRSWGTYPVYIKVEYAWQTCLVLPVWGTYLEVVLLSPKVFWEKCYSFPVFSFSFSYRRQFFSF